MSKLGKSIASLASLPCWIKTLVIAVKDYSKAALREKCPHSELSWSAFSRIWTKYGEILRFSLYSVWTRENANQNNSEYGHFFRTAFI